MRLPIRTDPHKCGREQAPIRRQSKSLEQRPRGTPPKTQTSSHRTVRRNPIQPLEPMLLPKLRIYFADFPWSHCSIDQRLFTSESGCGYRYGRACKGSHSTVSLPVKRAPLQNGKVWISDRAFRRIVKAPRTTQKGVPLSLCVQTLFST